MTAESPVRKLYDDFRHLAQSGRKGWSWVEFNAAADQFVLTLIRSGIAFSEADARWFLAYHHGERRPGEGFAENAYTAACAGRVPNDKTRKAIETALGRKPYVQWKPSGDAEHYMTVGSTFRWGQTEDGRTRWARVNSFNDDAGRINVGFFCYEQDPGRPAGYEHKVELSLGRITHDEFCAAFPRPKKVRVPKCQCGHGKKEHNGWSPFGSCTHYDDGPETWDNLRCRCQAYAPKEQP